MNSPEESPLPNTLSGAAHPEDALLASWSRGDLPPDETEALESHLEECDTCAKRLETISDGADPFLQRLRGAAGLSNSVAAPAPSDSNLLFGAMALQAGLITPQRFADACILWSSRGGMPLADLLVEQGWIDETARHSISNLIAGRGQAAPKKPAAETLSGRDPGSSGIGETLSLSPLPGERLRLRHLHSQGGIGQVWLAQDLLLGREVALKELLPELRGSKKHRERFFREARVAAQLSHPGTAPVYEYREEGGRCYYTMRFYSGKTLSAAIAETHAESDDGEEFEKLFPLIEHFLAVCDTVAYAHSQGIVHRDLKGENVVLGEFGEVTVIDWGLAKSIAGRVGAISPHRSTDDKNPTIEGERLGTPGYMAPEQARGDLAAIDHRTDVYGLAAVLYEVLTTRPPFSGATANEVMHHVETLPPAPPSLSHPATPHELEEICLRGLSKLAEERQQSATELRDEVRHWLSHQLQTRLDSDRQAKFFSLSHDLFLALDERGHVKQVNPAYAQYFGFNPLESPGKHYAERMHPDDVERAKRMFRQVQLGLSQKDFVIRTLSADGTYRSASWTATRVPGEPTIYAVGRPLDEASQRRRLSEERSRFFSLSRDLCIIYDEDFRVVQVNKALLDFLGADEASLLGAEGLSCVHPDDVPAVQRHVETVCEGESVQDIVCRIITKQGETHLTNWTLSRVSGERTIYAVGRPLDEETERRREMTARSQFFALSPNLFVISDEKGLAAQVNPAWTRLLGWEPEEVVGNTFESFVHPDDIGPIWRAARRALVREPVVDIEVRMRHKQEGSYRRFAWTLCRVQGSRINYAIGRDVTESKRAEDRLRAILDTGSEALIVVSQGGRIELVNRVLCRLFGYEPPDLEGKQLSVLLPEEHRNRHTQVVADYFREPTVRSMGRGAAFPAQRADGSRFKVRISLSPLLLNGGGISVLAAVETVYD